MKLIEKQRAFAFHLGVLLTEGLRVLRETYPGATLRIGEGYVGDSAPKKGPSVHRRDGGHFKRLAIDLMLDIDGKWIENGDHPAWKILQRFWAKLDPENGGGGADDMNHFGRRDGGVV